jgi:predicted transcriptional regulator
MWIEAKPLATITSVTVQKFFWQNIVCRFGVPKAITVDKEHSSMLKLSKNSVNKLARRFILHQSDIRSQMDLLKELMAL